MTKTRFAPSPTGMLHIGNARTALITWLFARNAGGEFLLRIDDTDQERSKEEYEHAIEDSLQWLGMDWDEKANQKNRMSIYEEKIEQLKTSGRLYPCYETPDELALKRKSQLSRGKPPIYDRGALDLTDEQKQDFQAKGRAPHWRFKMLHAPIIWQDLIRGEVKFNGIDISDPVVLREDGSPLYHLCSVIDDIDFGITHVTRGEDHVSNTAAHVQMFEALGAKPPIFAHLPLISDAEGGKLSKRLGSISVPEIRDTEGFEPMAINSLLARIGTSDPVEPFASITSLIESFDFSKFSRGTPKLDPEDLLRLNAKLLHAMPYDSVTQALPDMGLRDIDEDFWNAVRPNLNRLNDIKEWFDTARGDITPIIEDQAFIAQALELLPNAPWDETTWQTWTSDLKEKTGAKGKALFMPLRLALTGMSHGPDMSDMLVLIGRGKAVQRLSSN